MTSGSIKKDKWHQMNYKKMLQVLKFWLARDDSMYMYLVCISLVRNDLLQLVGYMWKVFQRNSFVSCCASRIFRQILPVHVRLLPWWFYAEGLTTWFLETVSSHPKDQTTSGFEVNIHNRDTNGRKTFNHIVNISFQQLLVKSLTSDEH